MGYILPGKHPFCGFSQASWNWIDAKDTLEEAIERAEDLAKSSSIKTQIRCTFSKPERKGNV